jgi:hypothetical protein
LRYANDTAVSLDEECPLFSTVEQAFVFSLEDNMQAFDALLCELYGRKQLPQPDFPLTSGRQPARSIRRSFQTVSGGITAFLFLRSR